MEEKSIDRLSAFILKPVCLPVDAGTGACLERFDNSQRFVGMRYRAHAVDLHGVSLADYEFECATDEDAKQRAASYLQVHPVLEVWQGVRRVARLGRDPDGQRRIAHDGSHGSH
jgi:hypothetical protein